ncbi:hypothetical protein CRD59_00210 [Bifidobacterium xylocopae]|uniref:ATPase AAA-type core domain-containing protein n=1 Tax=Bifidobacterium xylocopae TaxID=2493119 RepID=A0A366KFR3_9BIFI|nr:hypothetical protein CRD59_00210 [Bifidobacterium xylocopae]
MVVFIDEVDALPRTRGSGVLSDMETTMVPQFLAELAGVERLDRVLVIGASNRIDMVDPAVLRPGRFDLKIRVNRPDRQAGEVILDRLLKAGLPLAEGVTAHGLARRMADEIYRGGSEGLVCEGSDEAGAWVGIHLCDLVSGAMLSHMVDEAKTYAHKASFASGSRVGLGLDDCLRAVDQERRERATAWRMKDLSAGLAQRTGFRTSDGYQAPAHSRRASD